MPGMRQRVGEMCCQICQKLNYITPLKTAKMLPITLVNAWLSRIDARRQYILLVIITVSHGSAYTVVRATQQVNGKWQFFGVSELRNP